MNNTVNIDQVIALIDSYLSRLQLSRAEHIKLQNSMDIVRAVVSEVKKLKDEKAKGDETKKVEEKKDEKPLDNETDKALS